MADERDVPPLPRVPTAIRETLLAPAPELPRYPTVIRGSMPEGAAGAADAAGGVDPDAAVRIGAAPPKFPSLMDVGVSNAQAAANALPAAPLVGDPAGVAAPVPKFPSLTDVGVGPAQAAADAMGAGGGPAPMSPIAESPFHGRPSDVSMRSEAEPSFDSAGRSDSMGMAATRSSDVYADTEEQEGDHAPGDQIIDTDGEESTSDVQVEDGDDILVDDEQQATGGGIVARGVAAASAAVAAAGAAVGITKTSPEEEVEGEEVEEDYEDVEDDDNDDAGSSEYSISRDGRSLASGSMRLLDTDDEGKILGDAEGKDSDTKAAIAASGVAAARAVEARLAAQELADDVYSPAAASRATRFSGLPSETDSSSVNESEVDPMASGEDRGVRGVLGGRHDDDDSSNSDRSETTSETDPAAVAAEDGEPSTAAAAGASAAALAGAAVLGTHVATREARTTDEDGMPRVRSTTIETETVAAPGPDGTTVVSSTSTFTTRPGEAPPPPPAAGGSGDVGSGGDYEVASSRSAPPPPLVASAVVVPPSTTAPPPPPTASPYSSTVLPGTAPVAAAPSAAGGSQVLSPTDERSVAVVDGSAARAAEVHVTHDYALSGVHEMGVNDGVFLDVNTLATAGADGKVCVWDVDSATVKLQFTPFDNSEAVAVVSALPTAPGAHPQLVCMSARSRLMRIWTLTPDAAVLMSSMQLPRNEKDLIMTLPVAEPAVAEAAVAAHTAAAAAAAADAGATADESSEEESAAGEEEDDLTSEEEEGSETYLTGDDQMPSGEEDEEGVPTSAPGAMQSDRYSAPVSV